jgi:hypothetical protein
LLAPKTTNTVDIGSSALKFKDLFLAGNASVGGTLAVTGVATFTAQPVLSALTASTALALDASKNIVSVTNTGSGSNVLATSPTLVTPVLGAATATSLQGIIGNVTPAAGNFTTLGASSTATLNTLASSGATLTGGTINGMTIGATTASTGAFTSVTASTTLGVTGVATFSAGTALLPALTTTGDTNTGIWFPAADTIAFTEGGVESMRITSAGNVGIGTTSPTQKLQVVGSSLVSNSMLVGGAANGAVVFINSDGSAQTGDVSTDNTNMYLSAYSNRPLVFKTGASGGTEKMRLDSSGNLGLGVTPSAWAGHKILQVGSWASFGSFTGNLNSQMMNNAYWDGGAYRYIGSDSATYYSQTSGIHSWYGAPSGTSGGAVTFTGLLSIEKDKSLALQGSSSVSGTGITFPGTQSASSNANTLDDYEEGTFNDVAIVGSTTAGTGTYSVQTGSYTKVGNTVAYRIFLVWSAHTGTGDMNISGLPFSSASSGWSPCAVRVNEVTLTALNTFQAHVNTAASTISLEQVPVGGGSNNPIPMDTAGQIMLSGIYMV